MPQRGPAMLSVYEQTPRCHQMRPIDPPRALFTENRYRICNLTRLRHPGPDGRLVNNWLQNLHDLLSCVCKPFRHRWAGTRHAHNVDYSSRPLCNILERSLRQEKHPATVQVDEFVPMLQSLLFE